MMTSSSVTKNNLPPSLVSNLQSVLIRRRAGGGGDDGGDGGGEEPPPMKPVEDSVEVPAEADPVEGPPEKPVVLITNGEGIESPGLVALVEALVSGGRFDVNVCAPQSDKSVSGHSVTLQETITVSSAEINGATAFEVSGTPVDCISLALSGALFSWSKPTLVISGINRGISCGHHMFYSGVVAGAREALVNGVPSLSISLNWKKDESHESDFKDAVDVCLPLIHAAIRDIEKGIFPTHCSLDVEIPTSPSTNKKLKTLIYEPSCLWAFGNLDAVDLKDNAALQTSVSELALLNTSPLQIDFYESLAAENEGYQYFGIHSIPQYDLGFKVTRQSLWRSTPHWQAVSANRHPSGGQFMSKHQSLGIQLAQLSRDASAAGAARRFNSQRKNVEVVESVAAGKPDTQKETVRKHFRLEFMEKEQEDTDEDMDFRALENGFVAVTPLHVPSLVESEMQRLASDWIASALGGDD